LEAAAWQRQGSNSRTGDGMTIKTVGIIGAGQMGNGIAHVVAQSGYDVLLHDLSEDRVQAALATINGNMARQVSRGKMTEEERAAARSGRSDFDNCWPTKEDSPGSAGTATDSTGADPPPPTGWNAVGRMVATSFLSVFFTVSIALPA
jgi:hypothetical protein